MRIDVPNAFGQTSMLPNQGYCYRHVVRSLGAEHTLESYLANSFPHSTEAEWRERIQAGEILVDGRAIDGLVRLRPGSLLAWNRPGWIEEGTPTTFDVLYRDDELLAVNKPSGLPTLPGAGFYRHTLLSLVQELDPDVRPLHRLGRGTSGIVLFARTKEAARSLSRDWPQIQKQYLALGCFVASKDSYDIRTPIGKVPHPRLGTVHAACASGKTAHSVARTRERRATSTLFEVDLHTGRPHQIRIHLASIGHPLVGDPLYGVGGVPRAESPGLPGDLGYFLHAHRLRFEHPTTGLRLDLEAALPGPWTESLGCDLA